MGKLLISSEMRVYFFHVVSLHQYLFFFPFRFVSYQNERKQPISSCGNEMSFKNRICDFVNGLRSTLKIHVVKHVVQEKRWKKTDLWNVKLIRLFSRVNRNIWRVRSELRAKKKKNTSDDYSNGWIHQVALIENINTNNTGQFIFRAKNPKKKKMDQANQAIYPLPHFWQHMLRATDGSVLLKV